MMISKTKRRRAPSQNAVMYKAKLSRPTVEGVHARHAHCPMCAAPGEHLVVLPVQSHKTLNYTLACLGIPSLRLVRNKVTIECLTCGSSFCDAHLFKWNFAVSMRRYADFGMTSFPVPNRKARRDEPGLAARLNAGLWPSKRITANPRLRKRLVSAPKRAARLEQVRQFNLSPVTAQS
jgi:hypothetical protein